MKPLRGWCPTQIWWDERVPRVGLAWSSTLTSSASQYSVTGSDTKHQAHMEPLEETRARHRKEKSDLQARIASKKGNATKKTRKGVNDECAELERQLQEKHAEEIAALSKTDDGEPASSRDEDAPAGGAQEGPAEDALRRIDTMTLSEQAAPAPPPAKKRNRQKERLARRAAEQEAAVEAAEAEATSMVDPRAVERKAMEEAFAANSLVEKEIRPDGHCLFSAVADQLESRGVPVSGDLPGYKQVRNTAAGYIESNADEFSPFLDEPLDSYIEKIRDTAEWGGQMELQALANAYNLDIRVIQKGTTERLQPSKPSDEEPRTIWLAYYRHGYGLGEHYNSLRKAP
jgi:OTU domain-containing protein 6